MKNEQQIRERVMRRVYALYVMRTLLSPTARVAVVGASLFVIALSVSIPNVVQNMPSFFDVVHFSSFFISAFLNTQIVVQALVVVAGACAVWTGIDVVRTVGTAKALNTVHS